MAKLKLRGFSLLEMVVYVAILTFMLIVVIEVIVSISRSARLFASTRSVDNSALDALERVEREVRGAVSINTSLSTLGTTPGKLVLTTASSTVEFYLSGGRVRLKQGGVDMGALTEASSTVTSLIFRRFATSTIEGIRTEMVIESGTSTSYKSETFYASALIR